MLRRPPISTPTETPFPYTTLFRSADIDADIIDIIGPGVARIARLVKIADLGRDGGQEKAVADHDHRQPGVEHRREGQQEMAQDRKRTRLNSSHKCASRMPSSA